MTTIQWHRNDLKSGWTIRDWEPDLMGFGADPRIWIRI